MSARLANSSRRRPEAQAAVRERALDVGGLTPLQRSQIVNWRVGGAASSFTVVEQTVPEIQAALTRGETTSEDVVREYLARLSRFDRHGPALHSMLALNPSAIAVPSTTSINPASEA